MHVVRCFEDPDVVHTMGSVDPVRDIDVVNTELALADLDAVQKRIDKSQKKAKSGDKAGSPSFNILHPTVTGE